MIPSSGMSKIGPLLIAAGLSSALLIQHGRRKEHVLPDRDEGIYQGGVSQTDQSSAKAGRGTVVLEKN
jgi:hypothetical protein